MADYWWLVILSVLISIFAFQRWIATEKGRAKWDRIQLKIPIFGDVILNVAVARFTRTLSTLLQSGVPLLMSFEIVKNVVNNDALSQALDETKEAIREGADIAPPLKKTGQFPPMVTQMIAIGEKSGRLEEMLGRVANTYEVQVSNMVTRLTSLLEPIMILMMGGTVGFVVFSILKPILQMNTMVR
jgi:general secretion pathway protein F